MREWNLTQADPLSLRLAADVRLGPTDYANDHIWEMTLAGGDPAALGVRTSFGLRVQELRIFPGFAVGDQHVTDPADFFAPPAVRAFYVNYLRLACQPLEGLHVTADYWVPNSHSLAGQYTFHNPGETSLGVTMLLSATHKPLAGEPAGSLGAVQLETHGRAGLFEVQAAGLDIVILLEGPAQPVPAPYASLARLLHVPPGETVAVRWAQSALPAATEPPPAPVRGRASAAAPPAPVDHREAGLEALRELLAREWDGELARIELLNAGLLDIATGDPEWDAALAFAQTVALRSYVGPTQHLPHPSFVFTRHPDRGYSQRADGSDHNWQWNGQVATEAYVNLPQVVAAAPELAKGILRNWLAVQQEDGFIDWKPGLAGQREKTLCMPLLATMAWQVYEHTEDADFAREVYPGLRRFLDVWFSPRHDRDEDGLPEWTHTIHSAFDDNPSFVRWQKWGQGADISAAESPDLAAYVYRECRALQRMGALLGLEADPVLAMRAEMIERRVAGMWNDATRSYHYVDRDSHASLPGEVLAQGRGELSVDVGRRFVPPVRVLVKAVGPREARLQMEAALAGRGRRGRGRVETLRRSHVQWFFGIGTAVSDKLYTILERVDVRGLTDEFEVTVATVDYTRQDQTLLLPLWAGLPDAERAERLVRDTLLDPARYWRPFGIPNCSAQDPAYQPENRDGSGGVWMMWNTMLGEGLVDYGYRAEAAELVARLMRATLHTLKEDKAFREAYNADAPGGLGDRHYIWGVSPVALFMRTLGVRIISPRRVYLEGRNPFPWPVSVRHKGLTVERQAETTHITFPSGRSASVSGEEARFVEDAG
jgi:hypothetical protein